MNLSINHWYVEIKKMPFVRLLAALITGILLQWYGNLPLLSFLVTFIVAFSVYVFFYFFSAYQHFRLQWLRGMAVLIMLVACGGGLSYNKNPFHQSNHYNSFYKAGDAVMVTVDEPLLN